jgi:hypothetical protein
LHTSSQADDQSGIAWPSSYIGASSIATAAGLLFVVRVSIFGSPSFLLDDAFITIHNARHFLATTDPAFPTSVPLASATSIVHTAAVAALIGIGLDPSWALEITLWVAGLLYVLGLYRMCEISGCRRLETIAVCCLGLLAAHTPYHLIAGLETSLAMSAVAWGIAWALDKKSCARWWPGLLIGTMPFVRPELLAVSGFLAWPWWRARKGAGVLVILAAAAPWVVLQLWIAGSLVPATFIAKSAFFAERHRSPYDQIKASLLALAGMTLENVPLVVIGILGWLLAPTLVRRLSIAVPASLVALHLWHGPTALSFNYFRYLTPVLPWLIAGVLQIRSRNPEWMRSSLIAALLWSILVLPQGVRDLKRERYYMRALVAVSTWLDRAPLTGPILVHDVGVVAELSRKTYVDVVGVKTPASIAVHQELTAPDGGTRRSDAIARIACDQKARSFVSLRLWELVFHTIDGFEPQGWSVTPIFRTGTSALDYTVYELKPPATGGC